MNTLLFQREVLRAEELTEAERGSQYQDNDPQRSYHEQERDCLRYWRRQGKTLAAIGIENQTNTDPDMPIRVIGYDGGSYRSQLLNITGRHRFPVITIVLNYECTSCTKRKTLKQILHISEELEEYVNDYRLHVFDIAFLERSIIDRFKSDYWFIADYFWQVREKGTYDPPGKYMKYPREVLRVLSDLTKDHRFLEIYEEQKDGRRRTMCEYLDMLEKRGEKRGMKLGEKRGIRRGEKLGLKRGEKRGIKRQDLRWRKLILKLAEEGKQSAIIEAAADKELFEKLALEYHL